MESKMKQIKNSSNLIIVKNRDISISEEDSWRDMESSATSENKSNKINEINNIYSIYYHLKEKNKLQNQESSFKVNFEYFNKRKQE